MKSDLATLTLAEATALIEACRISPAHNPSTIFEENRPIGA